MKFAYICTFNNIEWTPVYWGKIDGERVTFKEMGRDIVCKPQLKWK